MSTVFFSVNFPFFVFLDSDQFFFSISDIIVLYHLLLLFSLSLFLSHTCLCSLPCKMKKGVCNFESKFTYWEVNNSHVTVIAKICSKKRGHSLSLLLSWTVLILSIFCSLTWIHMSLLVATKQIRVKITPIKKLKIGVQQ